jgi:thiol-disulfide isomerase/thioredoxin
MMIETLANSVLSRLAFALAIILAGLVAYRLANRAILTRAAKKNPSGVNDIPGARKGVPAILYFTAPDCAPCKTIQRPALKKVQDRLGDRLQVIEIDAYERPDLASRWGVMSVPTTFLLDEEGRLLHVNHGATRAEKIIQQMQI